MKELFPGGRGRKGRKGRGRGEGERRGKGGRGGGGTLPCRHQFKVSSRAVALGSLPGSIPTIVLFLNYISF